MTAIAPSQAVRLFGTDEPAAASVLLTAGPLTAELEAGNLRFIRWRGAEMIRAISFVVRDRDWGTYAAAISGLVVEQSPSGFRVAYRALAEDSAQGFSYAAEIVGDAGGTLSFRCRGEARTTFVTNRTGFVVLHPIDGVAGAPVALEHCDGSVSQTVFPLRIDPVQPFRNLRAMTHEFAPGSFVTCRMEGDAYETEDQRNWTDASYKTYVRPLALPWPYEIAQGETIGQQISLALRTGGEAARPAATAEAGAENSVRLRLGEEDGTMPSIGVALDPDDAQAAADNLGLLRAVGAGHLLCHHDPRRGHDRSSLDRMFGIATAIGAQPWLEFVVPGVETFEADIACAGEILAALAAAVPVVAVSPAADLKSTLPGSVWPPAPPPGALYRAARAAFPAARIGGGMFSYFTELNRKRPPLDSLDLVTFSTCPLVHAGDDRSAMETLEALPHVALSARAIAAGTPFHVGPSGIGMRLNPYGEAPKDNPDNLRQAMNGADPRQRGLFGAVWALGHVVGFAAGGASALTLGAAIGPLGLVHARGRDARPFFDADGAGGRLYPVFHVVRGLARLAGLRLRAVSADGEPKTLFGVGCRVGRGLELWIGNPSERSRTLDLSALGIVDAQAAWLDADSFVASTEKPDFMDALRPIEGGTTVGPYGVLRLTGTPENAA